MYAVYFRAVYPNSEHKHDSISRPCTFVSCTQNVNTNTKFSCRVLIFRV